MPDLASELQQAGFAEATSKSYVAGCKLVREFARDHFGDDLAKAKACLMQVFADMENASADRQTIGSAGGHSLTASRGHLVGASPASDSNSPMLSGDQSRSVQQDQPNDVTAQPPMPGEGRPPPVQPDQKKVADARPPLPKGQNRSVRQDQNGIAYGQPVASGNGQPHRAKSGHTRNATPARAPSGPSEAYLRAAAKSRMETARTMLYLHKSSTGKWYGDVCPYEFPGMKRDAKFAEAFEKVFGPFNAKQQRMKCGDLLSAKQQEEVWKLANAA